MTELENTLPGRVDELPSETKQRYLSEDYFRSLLRVNRMLRFIVFLQWLLIVALVFGIYYTSQDSLVKIREMQNKKQEKQEPGEMLNEKNSGG